MDFGSALDQMRKRRVVRRRAWKDTFPSCYISEHRNKIMGMRRGIPTGVMTTIFHEDMLAQDWEVNAEGFAPNEKASSEEVSRQKSPSEEVS